MAEKTAGFTAEERAAMKARAAELRAEAKASKGAAKKEADRQGVLEAIEALSGTDKVLAQRFHEMVTETAPQLDPKTWYGFPAYGRDGKAVCFFKASAKFNSRYATIGFNDGAQLDDGALWPTEFAIVEFTPDVEKRMREIIARAAG
ncbi:DUF1801 domain-containing protein [Microbacterium protaetiae]|uniref:DUF1801 domain-containing protein n=1 Tax=Microbacterium protaetiae TaxID=2509458 RepID=A0A4P6EC57_9MICO|nr:DUF1801 domain-containing protein [Microbacterium protaetiae]QAY59604.1 DUF1801 domain-containing protein [Microbacterium protaetiae]